MSASFLPAELALVSQIFARYDPAKTGFITGENAVKVFNGTKLTPSTLGLIWNIADEEDKGKLSRTGVAIAVRLIGWAQKGEKIIPELAQRPGPLASIDGFTSVVQQNTGTSLPKSPPPLPFPVLTPQDKQKFHNLFLKAGPVNGLLSGEKARDIFLKSRLPNDQLLKIWNLADTQDRGALDIVDFSIGMYFIQAVMAGKIPLIPTALPPGLYQQAGGAAPSVVSHLSGNSGSFSPAGPIFPQNTGTSAFKPALPARRPPPVQNGFSQDWDITPAEKAASDRWFDGLDTQKRGFIEGEVAVPFMLGSKLPEDVLASIWDLADIHNNGMLTRDGFAIAMHLIQKKLAGQELPASLPLSLVPPSLRSTIGQSPFTPVSPHAPHPPASDIDLLAWDDTPTAAPETILKPQITGGPTNALRPQATGSAAAVFGQSPFQTETAAPDPFASTPYQPVRSPDFLSEDTQEPAKASPFQDKSADIGNLKNQLASTNKSYEAVKREREALEQLVATQESQLSSIQTQLSSAKAAYDSESKQLEMLKERRAKQIADIQTQREELIRSESDLSAIRVERTEIEGALLRDKEEARDLHRRMIEAGQQADALKADAEKLKKEAKQQRGLLAIARKQLSTKEAERSKAEKEHEDAVAELTAITQEKETVESETASLAASPPPSKFLERAKSPADSLAYAAAHPLPGTPPARSPSIRNNNPFGKMAFSPPPTESPFIASQHTGESVDQLADAIFGTTDLSKVGSSPLSSFEAPASPEPGLSYLDETSSAGHGDYASPPTTAGATEFFLTPPTSATDSATRFPSIEEVAASVLSPKPEVTGSAVVSPAPPTVDEDHKEDHKPETDLNTALKDLDIDESDSDEDTDVDSTEFSPVNPVPVPAAAPVQPATSPEPKATLAPAVEATPSAASTFDDVFGSEEAPKIDAGSPPVTNGAPAFSFDAFEPVTTNGTLKADTTPAAVAGVDAFDQAMRQISTTSGTTTTPNLSFDTAFDDEFDFTKHVNGQVANGKTNGSAASAFPPIVNSQLPAPPSATNSKFDDLFTIPATETATKSPPSGPAPVLAPPAAVSSSFDDVFASFEPAPAPVDKLASTISSLPPVAEDTSMPGTFPPSEQMSPESSGFTNASGSRQPEPPRSPPAGRAQSPPPRVSSPKPRLSSSSSKEAHQDKPKEQPPRHSKISLRLFGKKKKESAPPPPPPSRPNPSLSPPQGDLYRPTSAASDDDVEAVKQLTDMGFSRTQAVNALEKYGYDVQRALNSLLNA